MRLFKNRSLCVPFSLLVCLLALPASAPGQNQSPAPTDNVLRVKAELVQTDVTVVDKRGHFVDGLKAEQFELRVDAKPQSLSFFEQVATGTAGEEKQLIGAGDNKAVLREAIKRLNAKYNRETTASQVSISEVDADLVASRGDRGLFAYLVEATMKEFQTKPINAVNIVKNRIRQINAQSRIAELDTLPQLESLIHS